MTRKGCIRTSSSPETARNPPRSEKVAVRVAPFPGQGFLEKERQADTPVRTCPAPMTARLISQTTLAHLHRPGAESQLHRHSLHTHTN